MNTYHSSLRQNCDVGELVRRMEADFTTGVVHVSKYVDFQFSDDINKIYAYLESKHISGPTDSMGREKPFFNSVLAARNIWYRATDLDRSNIRVRPTKSEDDVGAFLATIHLQDWMRREDFGTFLNSWGIQSAGFNESVVKFVEQDGRLIPSVVPWSRIICDPIDFAANPKIEILELTEGQLRKRKGYDQELVEELCKALAARETTEGQKKDNKADYIKLYEIHGEMPLSYLTGDEADCREYVQQMHVITFIASSKKGDHDDYTLFSGREAEDPYMLTALLPEVDGSIALRGAVKTLFDAQWMQNHTAKAIKDQLDLASKIVFQTSDPTFVAQNVLKSIENGDILIHKANEPLTMLNNKADIAALQSYGEQWKALGHEIAGISESMLGATAPSGTAWRQVDQLLQESHDLFELMAENKGLNVEAMLRKFVIPFLKKKMDTSEEVTATLSAHDIARLDARFVKNSAIRAANEMVKERILNGEEITPEEQELFIASYAATTQEQLNAQGDQRFFAPSLLKDKTWKEAFKDLEWDLECDITNESLDKNALATLSTVLTIVTDPARAQALQTREGRIVFNKILEITGAVSPVELATMPAQPQPDQGPAQPPKIAESITYPAAPEDVKRQIESLAGLQPSQLTPASVEAGATAKQLPPNA